MSTATTDLPRIAECRDPRVLPNLGRETVLETGHIHNDPRNCPARLVHRAAGYYCAGSMMRFDNESWGVSVLNRNGSTSGRRFPDEASARKLFVLWTEPA